MLISGNEAAGFGALAGGCRFLAAYPITPATEIMYWLVNHLPDYGGKVVQVEDEIGACLMAIGANYAGIRAMTSTSGPGFSLMQEAIGLAGIAEIPVVIVDVQRGGPATGLPTRTEQSDLNEMLYGSHGEIPRIVIAPATISDCFYHMIDAFNLAEQYQCVVIVATDMFMGMSKQSIPAFEYDLIKVKRTGLITDQELAELERSYKRYALTESESHPAPSPRRPTACMSPCQTNMTKRPGKKWKIRIIGRHRWKNASANCRHLNQTNGEPDTTGRNSRSCC